jgi:hypothetical protein
MTSGKRTGTGRRAWPWTVNPYSGRRHVVSWFMFRIAELFPGREIRLPFGHSTWKVTNDDS